MTSSPIYLLRLRLSVPGLFELGRRRGLPQRDTDLGYLVHCQLREAFGEKGPQPFSVTETKGRHLAVLGYAEHPVKALRDHADTFADPAVHAAIDWEHFDEKVMPIDWPSGRHLGFQLRACPVVRMNASGPKHRKGAEVDAFLARCFTASPDTKIDREQVYRDWLSAQLTRRGGVRLIHAKLAAFQRDRVLRRTHGPERTASMRERPDATFTGVLEVTDGPQFAGLLRQGIGRHRAFGFGMLLLRPPNSVPC